MWAETLNKHNDLKEHRGNLESCILPGASPRGSLMRGSVAREERAVTKEVALPAGARTSEGMREGGVDKLDGVAAVPKGRSLL